MKVRKRLILWTMLSATVLCLGIPTLLIGQQLRQDSLDHALIQAVKRLDAPAVRRLLNEGASANARDTNEPPLTLPRLLERLWFQLQHHTASAPMHPSALYLLLEQQTHAQE